VSDFKKGKKKLDKKYPAGYNNAEVTV